jgi:4'-phosphopantetheinyl transferase
MYPAPDPRIYCLLQSAGTHPGLAEGIPPAGLLSPQELARCDGLKVSKRRRDWLLGRWTAKQLLRAYLAATAGQIPSLDQIEILAEEDGAPYAWFGARLPISLSISHSGSESFCAICEQEVGQVGADIEQIEPRE